MDFIKKQKDILAKIGYSDSDIRHIEEVASETNCSIQMIGYTEKRISKKKAIDEIGEHNFMAGLARSAFHRTAAQPIEKGGRYYGSIFFDSSAYYEERSELACE